MRPHRIPRDAPLCRCTPMCRWCSSWAPAKPSRRRAPPAGRYNDLTEARAPPRVAAQGTSDGPFAATSVTPRSVRHGNLQHSQVLASRYGHQQHRIFHHPQPLRRGAWWGWPGPLTNEQSNKVEVSIRCLATINLTGRRQLSWPLFEAKVAGIFATRRQANVGQTDHHTTGQVIHEQQKARADTGAGQRQGRR